MDTDTTTDPEGPAEPDTCPREGPICPAKGVLCIGLAVGYIGCWLGAATFNPFSRYGSHPAAWALIILAAVLVAGAVEHLTNERHHP